MPCSGEKIVPALAAEHSLDLKLQSKEGMKSDAVGKTDEIGTEGDPSQCGA